MIVKKTAVWVVIVLLVGSIVSVAKSLEQSTDTLPCTHAEGSEEGISTSLGLGWNKTYGGIGSDYALVLVQTTDGGYALAGSTYSFGAGGCDVWLVKTSADGNHEWNKTYGGTGEDHALDLVQTTDGGYAIAGSTNSLGIHQDGWLIKVDASGNHLWNNTYGGTGEDRAYALVQTVDGGYALACSTYSFGVGNSDVWLVKVDASGNHLWNNTYGGTGEDDPLTLIQTTDGGYVLAGRTYSFGVGNSDFWLVKVDASGNHLWNNTYGGTGEDRAYALVQTVDGGYALAGTSNSWGTGAHDFWLVKTDAGGDHLWNKTYGGTGEDFAYALVETTDGGYTLTGPTYSFGASNGDVWLVKTSIEGNVQWNQTYGGTGVEYAGSIVQTSDGGYALAGMTGSFGAGSDDFWLVKTDENGVVPEFPSAAFLIVFMVLAGSVTILVRRKRRVG